MPAMQLDPPDVDLVPGRDGDDDVEEALEDQEEADHGCERGEGVAGVHERDDPDDDEDHAEQAVQHLPPPMRRGEHEELVDPGRDRHYPEQDRDRGDGGVVEAEHDDREEEPEEPGQEKQPPGASGAFDYLALLEVERGHAASLGVVRAVDARTSVGRRAPAARAQMAAAGSGSGGGRSAPAASSALTCGELTADVERRGGERGGEHHPDHSEDRAEADRDDENDQRVEVERRAEGDGLDDVLQEARSRGSR